MAKIMYVRVSSESQNEDRQLEMAEKIGVDRIFEEKISGKDTNRKQLQAMLEYVRENDEVYIESFSRLARSCTDLLHIVEKLKEKKVELISLKENIDTSTSSGKFALTIFGALAELERETIKERQKQGIAIAKKQGKYKGRKKKKLPKNTDEVLKEYQNADITVKIACKRLDISIASFYRLIKERGIKREYSPVEETTKVLLKGKKGKKNEK